jgi:hypothetical protein
VLATGVAVALLAAWVTVVLVLPARHRAVVLAAIAAVSVAATAQMTVTISRASVPGQEASLMTGLRSGDQIAVSRALSWESWVPQAYEVSWTTLQFFRPYKGDPPPSGATVVEVPWTGKTALASWPQAPSGWHVFASSAAGGWVAWRDTPLRLALYP